MLLRIYVVQTGNIDKGFVIPIKIYWIIGMHSYMYLLKHSSRIHSLSLLLVIGDDVGSVYMRSNVLSYPDCS